MKWIEFRKQRRKDQQEAAEKQAAIERKAKLDQLIKDWKTTMEQAEKHGFRQPIGNLHWNPGLDWVAGYVLTPSGKMMLMRLHSERAVHFEEIQS